MEAIAREWLISRNVIRQALMEMGQPLDIAERNAAAIIARLASHDPPILLEMQADLGHYACGCPVVPSSKIKAFCPTHLEPLKDSACQTPQKGVDLTP